VLQFQRGVGQRKAVLDAISRLVKSGRKLARAVDGADYDPHNCPFDEIYHC
jgi:hypothetical protein